MVSLSVYDIIMALALFWPIAVGSVMIFFLALVLFAIFVGSTIAIILLCSYAVYVYLKDYGWFDWAYKEFMQWKSRTISNLQKSFVVDGPTSAETSLYICFPHGLYGFSWFIHFCSGFSDWPTNVARPRLAIHSIFFRIPFVRELMITWGCIEATEDAICKSLEKGESVAIVLGGVEELQLTAPGKMKIVLEKRKGYARIAHRQKVPIVPLFTIGENELFPAVKSPLWCHIQDFLYKRLHIATPLPTYRSFMSWFSITRKPLKTPLITHFLDPILTEQKSIDVIQSEVKKRILDFRDAKHIDLDIVA
jgi:hypothetical protein